MGIINYKFLPTEFFLIKAATAFADFEYEVVFTSGFQPNFLGEGTNKIVANDSTNFFDASSGSFPEKINFATQAESQVSASTEIQEIDFSELNLSSDRVDGIFLYSGSQVAFYSQIDPPSELESLEIEDLPLQLYPVREFAEQVFKEQIFNTMANSYYLGYSSGPIEYSGGWATDADWFEGEVTQETAPERSNLARAYMSNAEFIFDESAPSFIASFPDVVHLGGTSDEAIATAFILEKSKDPEQANAKGNVIFAATADAEGELKKGATYTGDVILIGEWLLIL